MGGGSTPQLCARCGSELRAEARFCRICGHSVLGDDTGPIPFPELPAVTPASRHRAPRPAAAPWEAPHWAASVREVRVEEAAVPEAAVQEAPVREAPVEEAAVPEATSPEVSVWQPAVREPAVREPAVREPAVREPAVREPAVREPAVREPAAREPAVREPAVRQAAFRGATFWVAPVEEAPVQETPIQEAVVPAATAPEVKARQAAVREAAVREVTVEEAPVQEAAAPEVEVRQAAVREVTVEEASVPEAPVREAAVREAAVREAAVREAAVREAAVREAAVREAPIRDKAGAAAGAGAGAMSFNLAGGSYVPPTWSHEDTVTSLAIPAIPEDWQALRYRATAWSDDDSEPAAHRRRGYQPPSKRRGPWLRRIIVGVLVAMVAVGGSAGGLLIARAYTSRGPAAGPSNFKSVHGPASPGLVSPDSAAQVSGSAPGEQQAAEVLAALLSQSVASRAPIDRAFNDVRRCGSRLAQDQTTFLQAVAARQDLLGRLVSLPDGATLPAGTVGALTLAWQASISADRDFAAWAQDESAKCRPAGRDASLSAATALLNQALRDKAAFVSRWNPVARHYGLRPYSWEQL
jgi:hypothetical protein